MAEFPYPSKISFLPLINHWEGKLNSKDRVERLVAEEIDKLMKIHGAPLRELIEELEVLAGLEELVELLISLFIPFHDKKAFLRITGPFNTLPFYHSIALQKLLSNNQLKLNIDQASDKVNQFIIYRAGCLILNQHYGQELRFETPYIFTIQEKGSGLERHFKAKIDSRFSEAIPLKPLKKLSNKEIQELLNNVEDSALWLRQLPPANFEFQGIFCTLLTDTSIPETLSRLKEKLLQRDALLSEERIGLLEQELRTYFKQVNLRLGVCTVDYLKMNGRNKQYGIKHGLISDKYPQLLKPKHQQSIYSKVAETGKFIVQEDLTQYPDPTSLEKELLARGIRSILVAPLVNKDQQVIGLMELGSPEPHQLNSLSVLQLKEIISLFNVAIERSHTEIINQIEAVIRENFTSIHPSVEWAFVEKAMQMIDEQDKDHFFDDERFVFRDNYPLYGQADIIGSTVHRNRAIQADLIDNLYQIKKILNIGTSNYDFPLVDQLIEEVDNLTRQLKRGVTSNSEYHVMSFIRDQVHPVLQHLKKKNPAVKKAFKIYAKGLDPQLHTIYKKRKDYEICVGMINRMLSNYLDKQEEAAQEMCPHYFEKFQTDGISYNIYVGQSLLRKGKFTTFHLHNLRLWQLITMCEITKKMAELQPRLPVPLTTAQLIFVHGTPLSIRFRMDEKRFDVDGAYNARYEIIKKRIDKAVIEESNERLTTSGKVAIVYQQEKDRKEYLGYLNYLIKKKYISNQIEELSLKRMQGVQGLKALRVTVNI